MSTRLPTTVRSGLFAAATLTAVLSGCSGSSDAPPAPSPSSAAPSTSAAAFRDGTYSAEGIYGNGPSFIGVTLTLADGVIIEANVETRATNPTSLDLQERFAAAVPDVVVGQPLADLEVDKLAGSSNTPDGFNDALDQIRAEAAID